MIDHVQLACPPGSEDASRAFYGGVLGLAEKPKPPLLAARGGCWFAGYGIELHLGVEADFRPARKAHPGLLWTDLDGLAERLAAAGYRVHWADPAEIPGRRRFHTTDPHGNRLEFLAPDSARSAPLRAKSIGIVARRAHTADMHAEFHRTDNRGGYVVIIRRDDGLAVRLPGYDRTWRVPHDLAHFVTEREFRLDKGVFGSIAAGAMFSNMAVVDGRPRFDATVRSRAVMRAHAAELGLAELVAGVVHDAVERGERLDQALPQLREAWGTVRSGPCPYPPETLRRALSILDGLAERWQALPEGARLTLRWDLPAEVSAGRRGAV